MKALTDAEVQSAIAVHYTPRAVESHARRGRIRPASIVYLLAQRWGIKCSARSITQS